MGLQQQIQIFTWLSLVMSLIASFCAVLFFPEDVLDEIWDLIESVSEGFLSYSYIGKVCFELLHKDQRRLKANSYISGFLLTREKILLCLSCAMAIFEMFIFLHICA